MFFLLFFFFFLVSVSLKVVRFFFWVVGLLGFCLHACPFCFLCLSAGFVVKGRA